MGVISSPRSAWGGRWTAVHSLWTYVHRLLHLIGVGAVDHEELALLSAPLVRIRFTRHRRHELVLAHDHSPLFPDQPVAWVDPADVPLSTTLFFLHFDPSNPQRSDRARIATAAPVHPFPRAWLTVNRDTGIVTLTSSELLATVFELRSPNPASSTPYVSFKCVCTPGPYLTIHRRSMRARVCAPSPGHSESFLINHVPLPPNLDQFPHNNQPLDSTMLLAYNTIRSCPLRIQSKPFNWFLTSKPSTPLASSHGNDSGWDGFTLEYDSPTRSVRIRDSRGLYLTFTPDLNQLIAKPHHLSNSAFHNERFRIELQPKHDLVAISTRKGYLSATRNGRLVLSQNTLPNERECFYLRIALPSMMDQRTPRLRLRVREGGARHIDASIIVPTTAEIGYQVISDYEGFQNFINDASHSSILERSSPTELVVRMVQTHTFLMLTIPMSMTLNVVENPERNTIVMDLKSGLGVKEYKGRWQAIERPDGRCLLRCALVATSSVPAPGFLMDGLMTHAMYSTMEQLRVECIRRSALHEEQKAAPKPKRQRPKIKQIKDSPQQSLVAIAARLIDQS